MGEIVAIRPNRSVTPAPNDRAGNAGVPSTKPRLLDTVRGAIRARHYSRRTEEAYVYWIRRFIVFHGKRHPRELDTSAITAFLTALAVTERVSASTQNQALSAVLFLYRDALGVVVGEVEAAPRARTPVRVPVVLSPGEVRRVLSALSGVPWLVAALLYGAGLRLQECLSTAGSQCTFTSRAIGRRPSSGWHRSAWSTTLVSPQPS